MMKPSNMIYPHVLMQNFLEKKKNIDNKRKHLSAFFERFQADNSKFNLQTFNDKPLKEHDITFLEGLCSSLFCGNVSELESYLRKEDFDSDALIADVNEYLLNKTTSNIYEEISNDKLIQRILKYIRHQELKDMAFSTGFVFWYWPYYAPTNDEEKSMPVLGNDNDFSGYTKADLYIKCGNYDNFKDEILCYSDGINGIITMKLYQETILLKTMQFIKTNRAKSIKAKKMSSIAPREYGIILGSPILTSHIMAIILYCDFSALSKDFSSTFRCIRPLETITAVKHRNKKYYWMSRYLREAVEMYGDRYAGDWHSDGKGYVNLERGPFYCGISAVLIMPSFSIRLNGPTSTTKHLEVA
eukprot:544016_1